MRLVFRRSVIGLVIGFSAGCLVWSAFAVEIGKYYTTANIWFEHPHRSYSTNYHKGQIIPAGAEAMQRFTGDEKKNIARGTLSAGMRRSAVLMAYGYPPSHRTPDLESNLWIYWESRFRTLEVRFEDGQIVNQ